MSNARNLAGIVTDTPSTTSLSMPVGTTAQRPASPQAGMYRLNSTTGEPEWYDTVSGTWVTFRNGAPYSVESLVIAGGGGGGVHPQQGLGELREAILFFLLTQQLAAVAGDRLMILLEPV
jgi:hypothetical protein